MSRPLEAATMASAVLEAATVAEAATEAAAGYIMEGTNMAASTNSMSPSTAMLLYLQRLPPLDGTSPTIFGRIR
jgi:hypothetical protein